VALPQAGRQAGAHRRRAYPRRRIRSGQTAALVTSSTGACFAIATALSGRADLPYVEGFAGTARLPVGVEHAWCLDDTGTVLEPTWPAGTGLASVGLAVTAAFRRGVPEPCLLHPHPTGLHLLRHGIPEHALTGHGIPIPTDPPTPATNPLHAHEPGNGRTVR
jgi:hypothetical protein